MCMYYCQHLGHQDNTELYLLLSRQGIRQGYMVPTLGRYPNSLLACSLSSLCLSCSMMTRLSLMAASSAFLSSNSSSFSLWNCSLRSSINFSTALRCSDQGWRVIYSSLIGFYLAVIVDFLLTKPDSVFKMYT